MKESEEDRLKSTIYESTLSTADAVPLPQWGRLRNEDTAIPDTLPSPRREGAPKGRIGQTWHERQMRKTERCAAYVGARVLDREWQRLNQCFLKIIRAPSSGRGRRAKRGGVGFPECGSTVSRDQPPPLRGTSFQRKEGEKRGCVYRHRSICGEVGAFSAISATPEPAPTISFPEESGEVCGTCGGSVSP